MTADSSVTFLRGCPLEEFSRLKSRHGRTKGYQQECLLVKQSFEFGKGHTRQLDYKATTQKPVSGILHETVHIPLYISYYTMTLIWWRPNYQNQGYFEPFKNTAIPHIQNPYCLQNSSRPQRHHGWSHLVLEAGETHTRPHGPLQNKRGVSELEARSTSASKTSKQSIMRGFYQISKLHHVIAKMQGLLKNLQCSNEHNGLLIAILVCSSSWDCWTYREQCLEVLQMLMESCQFYPSSEWKEAFNNKLRSISTCWSECELCWVVCSIMNNQCSFCAINCSLYRSV